jgi:hypothetical protein
MKEGIVSMDKDDMGIGGVRETIADEFGRVLNEKVAPDADADTDDNDNDDDDEAGEKEAEPKNKEDDGSAEWKGVPEKFYKRFKSVNDEVKSLKESLEKRGSEGTALSQKATAFDQLMQNDRFRKVVAEMVADPEGQHLESAASALDKINFEDMTDPQIASVIASDVKKGLMAEINSLRQTVESLVGKHRDTEVSGFIANEQKFPGAKENEKAIKQIMSTQGIDFEKAYYQAMGPNLFKIGEQNGLKTKEAKEKKDVHHTSKKSIGGKVPGKVGSLKDAFKQSIIEMGLDPGDYRL